MDEPSSCTCTLLYDSPLFSNVYTHGRSVLQSDIKRHIYNQFYSNTLSSLLSKTNLHNIFIQ